MGVRKRIRSANNAHDCGKRAEGRDCLYIPADIVVRVVEILWGWSASAFLKWDDARLAGGKI